MSDIRVENLCCNFMKNPLGIDSPHPRFSWQIEGRKNNLYQKSYQIHAASSLALLESDQPDLWDSGLVNGFESLHIRYEGAALCSEKSVFWKVRIVDEADQMSTWSSSAFFTMGLLEIKDWQISWIGLEEEEKRNYLNSGIWISAVPPLGLAQDEIWHGYFRKAFRYPSKPFSRIYFLYTGDAECTGWINGRSLGSRNDHRRIKEHDLTERLHEGENVIALTGRFPGKTQEAGGVIAVLRIDYKDGTKEEIVTDSTWKTASSELPNWNISGFNDEKWSRALEMVTAGAEPWGPIRISEDRSLAARYCRKEFSISSPIKRGMIYYSGLGWSELYINGKKIGDEVLSPSLSSYPDRVYYMTKDVTDSLQAGINALGVILGNGRFYSPRSEVYAAMPSYGFPKLMLVLRIELIDGRIETITSDSTWKVSAKGPILENNHFDGEIYDARFETPLWNKSGFMDDDWIHAQIMSPPGGILCSQNAQLIRKTAILSPVSFWECSSGRYIFDFGQNITGWCRLQVNGKKGEQVVIRHGENLKENGQLCTANLRGALQRDVYILSGKGAEVWEPRFTSHGFRYAEVEGYPGIPNILSLQGVMINDDLPETGFFSTSNSLLNKLYNNALWGLKGNYESIPMDCPQRDERQGWLGDRIEVMRGESFVFDTAAFYKKWLSDIRDSQHDNGAIPDVAPAYWPGESNNVTWPSALFSIMESHYTHYGDIEVLEENFLTADRWMRHMIPQMHEGLIDADTWGDWCVPPSEPTEIHSNDPRALTSKAFVATSFFYYDARKMEYFARILGRKDDEERYVLLASELHQVFHTHFYNEKKECYDTGSQTSYILPLAFGLVPENLQEKIFQGLADDVEFRCDSHIGCGMLGLKFLYRVLSDFNRVDLAYKIITTFTYPGYGYMISQGATTLWELWNGNTADPYMNSGNHVMLLGDLLIWKFEVLGGIRPCLSDAGFAKVLLSARFPQELEWVNCRYNSIRGMFTSEWRKNGKGVRWVVEIPGNSRGVLPLKQGTMNVRAVNGKDVHFFQESLHNDLPSIDLGNGSFEIWLE